jgi:ADP-ribosylglycohydrolase
MSSNPADNRSRIRRSALWAAYGDALGFITEGVDTAGVRRRVGSNQVEKTMAWKRKIGRFGPSLELPAGCLSDDTQLRLATSRSIRGSGEFDVETFAKIELTVWPSYALGAGIGSQAAAANLRRRDTTWATNFFSSERSRYLDGGGNGAAMRIQPHVWAHPPEADIRRMIAAVMQNAVATHGHPRGIVGAVFHARCLHHALTQREVPGPETWNSIVSELPALGELAKVDPLLGELWLGQWEQRAQQSFAAAVDRVVGEVKAELDICCKLDLDSDADPYSKAVDALDALDPKQRGSGTKTAILAAILSYLFRDDPGGAVLRAANCLGTDTDTIATMAGAISGALAATDPSAPIADHKYIIHEADRMWAIASGGTTSSFRYPSLVSWTTPKSASDCVGKADDHCELTGLGPARSASKAHEGNDKGHSVWQWLDLWFGQRLLAKRRPDPPGLPASQIADAMSQYLEAPEAKLSRAPKAPSPDGTSRQESFESIEAPAPPAAGEGETPPSIHDLTREAIASGFDPTLVGRLLLEVSDRDEGIEAAIGYAAIIAKARVSRRTATDR